MPLFDFGKVAVGALQLLTPLPAVVVVRAPCQFGALFGLSSQEFHRSHVGTPRIPRLLHCSIYYFAMQRKLHCPQQVSDWLGNDGARGHESGNVPKDWRALAQ
ncbi:MAG: hypothetical protein WB614_24590 [Pseudolabrys sp.]